LKVRKKTHLKQKRVWGNYAIPNRREGGDGILKKRAKGGKTNLGKKSKALNYGGRLRVNW